MVFSYSINIPSLQFGYYSSKNYIIQYKESRLFVFKFKKELKNDFENQYCEQLRKIRKDYIINLRKKCIKHSEQIKMFKNNIWIINDRRDKAGDNGEYFFRYLKIKHPERLNIYFAIEKNSSDYNRLKAIGDILDLNSNKYINLFMVADKIISSISNNWVYNPFKNDYKYIRDLLHYEIIFLQHGIIKDDLSKYLNRFNKKYDYFITSTKKEYKSLLLPKYLYNKNNIILTGLPRYDYLYRLKNIVNKKKKIIIIPTWRINIKGTVDQITYKSIHSDIFVFTEFFKFYNNLINDAELLLYMNKYNYTGIFCLHPCFSAQWIDFNQNKYFSVFEKCDYQKFLLEGSLLITDYSSIFFDFGYLRKPIIYTHFDYEEYRNNHYQKGYFNYIKDGFGPVCKDIKSCIEEIIYEIKNNCNLRSKYLRRINKFFTFSDENNCERIFQKITKNNYNKLNYTDNIYIIFILTLAVKIILKKRIFF